ncbi:MAG: hypothetical protein J07HB67_02597 [halophilic archaeon J07HB67]|nr:MAG: hypothetical protein J07HB67_02597 [halophilic archaeon J07HB67]
MSSSSCGTTPIGEVIDTRWARYWIASWNRACDCDSEYGFRAEHGTSTSGWSNRHRYRFVTRSANRWIAGRRRVSLVAAVMSASRTVGVRRSRWVYSWSSSRSVAVTHCSWRACPSR